MSILSIQQILNSRFRTSTEADKLTVSLMSGLGLSTKANVARLAIGRSLALGAFKGDCPDSKGLEIPAASLFSHDDIGIWVGLIVTHAQTYDLEAIDSMDAFRGAVRNHWHRGAVLLMEDWQASGDGNDQFDKFLETLIVRRAELPDIAPKQLLNKEDNQPSDKPLDLSTQLVKALADIGVLAEIKGLTHGPRITRYKIFLPDINQLDRLRRGLERLSIVLNLHQSIPTLSRSDEAKTVSLDVPRPKTSWQPIPFENLRQWVNSSVSNDKQLVVFPGVDILGAAYSFDLATAPHLLVGGTTGSGKSVCLHSLILSLMLRLSSSELKLVLIDPKQVEFSAYSQCNYIYGEKIYTDISSTRECINNIVEEMESRYQTFASTGVSNITEARQCGIILPFIVVFIEELSDLILQDRDIENEIVRLAQKARAAGIHLVLATQRPDAKTFSGLIRSNIPARIALTVQKGTESTIILDETGAENLLGAGDMLVKAKPGNQPDRVHGVRASRADIESVLRERGK